MITYNLGYQSPLSFIQSSSQEIDRSIRIGWISRFLNFLEEKLQASVRRQLDEIYVLILGSKEIYKQFDAEQSKKEADEIRQIISFLRKQNDRLQQVDYFNDASIKEKVNLCLDEMYEIEGQIRIKAFSKDKHTQTDSLFLDQLVLRSKEAVQANLAK